MKLQNLYPATMLFILVSAAILVWRESMRSAGIGPDFILVANLICFLLSIFGFLVQSRTAISTNPHAFMRGIYTSVLVKMLVLIAALFIYIVVAGGRINKIAILLSLLLYLLYSSFEVVQLMKIARNKEIGEDEEGSAP